jgi:Zn-dependent protease
MSNKVVILVLVLIVVIGTMLPIPPLDGGQILMALLPPQVAMKLSWIYQYGFLILMGLLVMGVLGLLISRPYYLILSWLM